MIARRLLYTGSGAMMTSALLATSAVIVAPSAENDVDPLGWPLVDSGLVAATEVVVVTVLPAIASGCGGGTTSAGAPPPPSPPVSNPRNVCATRAASAFFR